MVDVIVVQDGAQVPGASGTTSVADAAALTALSTNIFLAGALAYVQTRTTIWGYQPTETFVDDGWHIAAAGGAGSWVYVGAANSSGAIKQDVWNVDQVHGSDDNDGLTEQTAVKRKSEIARRWGTWSPELSVGVVVKPLSPDTDDSDPGLFAPTLVGQGTFSVVMALPAPSFLGMLNVVTAQNPATKTPLSATVSVTSGAVAADMLLVNTTRGSRALVRQDLGGGNWQLDQPYVTYNLGDAAPTATDSSWAHGDAVTGYVLQNLNLPRIAGDALRTAEAGTPGYVVLNATIWDPTGFVDFVNFPVDLGAQPFLIDCVVERACCIEGSTYVLNVGTQNVGFRAYSFNATSPTGSGAFFINGGHIVEGGNLTNVSVDGYLSVGAGSVLVCQDVNLTGIFLESGAMVLVRGNCRAHAGAMVSGGTLAIDRRGGVVHYGTATASQTFACDLRFQTASGLASTAYSIASGTIRGGITLDAAHLDAAAGPLGFGGLAFVPGVGAFTNGSQP